MKHGRKTKRFGRTDKVRTGFLRSLLNNLIIHERIMTTEARAKTIRPQIEKLVTIAKNNIDNRQLAIRKISAELGNQPDNARKLLSEITPRFENRNGGYTRILKVEPRQGDASPRAVIAFVE